jgi:hypothetical protein
LHGKGEGSIVKAKKYLWLPAGIGLIYTLFISLFAADAFSGDALLSEKIVGFIIHLMPSIVSLIILAVSWKSPVKGGALFILLSVVFTLYFGTYKSILNFLVISFPLAVIGILFIILQVAKDKRMAGSKKA